MKPAPQTSRKHSSSISRGFLRRRTVPKSSVMGLKMAKKKLGVRGIKFFRRDATAHFTATVKRHSGALIGSRCTYQQIKEVFKSALWRRAAGPAKNGKSRDQARCSPGKRRVLFLPKEFLPSFLQSFFPPLSRKDQTPERPHGLNTRRPLMNDEVLKVSQTAL